MAQLLFANIEAADSLEDLAQVVGTTEEVDHVLDLSVIELQVREDRQVGSEGAKDAVIAKMDDTVGDNGCSVYDLSGIGLVLDEAGIILGRASVVDGRAVVVDSNRTSFILGSRCKCKLV